MQKVKNNEARPNFAGSYKKSMRVFSSQFFKIKKKILNQVQKLVWPWPPIFLEL